MKNSKLINCVLLVSIILTLVSCNKDDSTPNLSGEKQITSFIISNLTPQVVGVIDQVNKKITISVPAQTDITSLVCVVTISDKATVLPISGSTINFTTPQYFTVTAEDKSTASYLVTVEKVGVDPEVLSGTMTANRTLPDLGLPVDYVIDGMLYIDGNALLTIDPDVKILFTNINSGILVGENAGLKMVGTAIKPIIFSGPINNNNKGSWNHIRYNSKRSDNQMEYVQLLNGGSSDGDWGVLQVYGWVSMKHCLIDGSLCSGINIENEGKFTSFDNNTITNCNEYPIYVANISITNSLNSNLVATNNGKNYIKVEDGSLSIDALTLKALAIPYFFKNSLYIDNLLTIEAGATLLFGQGERFNIEESGKLIAEGNATKHITIRGLVDEAGYWDGIMLSSTLMGNRIIYCDISGGGSSDGWTDNHNLYLRNTAKITIQNTSITKSNFYGIVLEDRSSANFSLTHSNVTFSECRTGNVYDEYSGSVYTLLP